MEEMGFAEPAQDLWDSRRTLPIFGTTRTSLLTRYGMKPWDSQLHANSKYFFQPCKPTKTLNAVVRTDLPLSWKREGFVFNLRRYGMPVVGIPIPDRNGKHGTENILRADMSAVC